MVMTIKDKKKKLTPKQEAFVQGVVSGKSQYQAYRDAYDCKTASRATIDRKATALAGRDTIRTRISQLKGRALKKAEDEAVDMRAYIIKRYQEIASGECCNHKVVKDGRGKVLRDETSVVASDVGNALKKLAELYGVEMTTSTQEVKVSIEGLDDSWGG